MQNHRRTGTLYCIEDFKTTGPVYPDGYYSFRKGDALVWDKEGRDYAGIYPKGVWVRHNHNQGFRTPQSSLRPNFPNEYPDKFSRTPPKGFPKVTDDAYRYEEGRCVGCGKALPTYTQKLVLPGRLPAFNDMLDAVKRRGRRGHDALKFSLYWKWKKDIEATIVLEAKAQGIRPVTLKKHGRKIVPIRPKVTFYEPDEKRDADNVTAAQKFIWDALVTAGILPADGRKYVACPLLEVLVDREHPRVEVELP